MKTKQTFQPGDRVMRIAAVQPGALAKGKALGTLLHHLGAEQQTQGVVVHYHGKHDPKEPRVRWASGWGTSCNPAELRPLTTAEAKTLPAVALVACDAGPVQITKPAQAAKIPPYRDENDPAAVLAIAMSLHVACLKADKRGGKLSEAYNGGDQFMRECMKVANLFEGWACKAVNFDNLDECWPYLLEEQFGKKYLSLHHYTELAGFTEAECPAMAKAMRIPLL